MLNFGMAENQAQSALRPLFEAYAALVADRNEWIASLELDPEIAAARPEIDRHLAELDLENFHAVSGCIVVVADNVLKATAHAAFRALPASADRERARLGHGARLGNSRTPFSSAIYAGANAFRHFEEWQAGGAPHATTRAILDDLGLDYNDEVCTRILALLTPAVQTTGLTYQRFMREIEHAAVEIIGEAERRSI